MRLDPALVETLEYGEFVSPRRLGIQWWIAPELLADFDDGGRPLVRWLAARIDSVTEGEVTLHYADIAIPADPGRRPERAWTTISVANLKAISRDELPKKLPGTILEIGIYGDGEHEGSTVARVTEPACRSLHQVSLPLGGCMSSGERWARVVRRAICRLRGHRWEPVEITYRLGETFARVGREPTLQEVVVTWVCDEMCARCGAETWWPA